MDRRDFFGVIAAPLLRQMIPPIPMMRTEPSFVTGLSTSGYNPLTYLGVCSYGVNAGDDAATVINKIVSVHEADWSSPQTVSEVMSHIAEQTKTTWGFDQNGCINFTSA